MHQNKDAALKIGTRSICYCGVFVALIAASSQIAVPIPFSPAPVSLSVLMILLCGVLNPALSLFSVVAYVFLGAVGLPVFAGFKGAQALLSATGGYIIGYLPAALASGFAFKYLKKPVAVFLALVGAVCILLLCGTVFFLLYMPVSFGRAVLLCFVPFLPLDIMKAALATVIGLRLKRALKL